MKTLVYSPAFSVYCRIAQRMNCLNCHTDIEGKYCHECGQKASVKRFTVSSVIHEIPHSLFHVDKGVMKNLIGLKNPKATVFAYLSGKRASYYSPFLFFIISTALVLFAEYVLQINLNISVPMEFGNQTFDAGVSIAANRKYLFLVSVFIYALPAWPLFKKETGLNYAEQVVVQLFVLGWCNLVQLLYFPFVDDSTYPLTIEMLLPMVVLNALVLRGNNLFVSVVKSLILVALQAILFLTILFIAAFIVTIIRFPKETLGL